MKCPKCGKEIANDSVFCEQCGAQVVANSQRVSSTLVAWIMFLLVICFSVAEMIFVLYLTWKKMENPEFVAEHTVIPSLLLIAIANISVFVISIVLKRKKQLRKSTSIALYLMSASIAIGVIGGALTTEVGTVSSGCGPGGFYQNVGILIQGAFIAVSIILTAVIAVVYAIYWLIAKAKHISF